MTAEDRNKSKRRGAHVGSGGSPDGRNAKGVLLIKGILLPMTATNKKKITFLSELVRRGKVRNDQLSAGALGDIKKAFSGLLYIEEV